MDTMSNLSVEQIERNAEQAGENSHQDRDMANRFQHIPGWGVDADPKNNPTYPMKKYTGDDHRRLDYERAPQQPLEMEILQSIERPNVTRVFGTSTPPMGLSGAIRRLAYKYSEATATRWMTLILADRVNVLEGWVSDLGRGHVPNLWLEKGWRSEWKTNRPEVVKKVAVGVIVATAVILVLTRKKKNVFG